MFVLLYNYFIVIIDINNYIWVNFIDNYFLFINTMDKKYSYEMYLTMNKKFYDYNHVMHISYGIWNTSISK